MEPAWSDAPARRTRRQRSVMMAITAVIVVATVAGGWVALRSPTDTEPVRSLGSGQREQPVKAPVASTNTRPVFRRTATIGGLAVTSPSDWSLVDYWGDWNPDATSLDSTAIPLLELTNFDPGLSTPVCDVGPGEPTRLPADGVAIFVKFGNDGTTVADLCGGSIDASSTGMIGANLYRTVMTLGPAVTVEDRATAEKVWRSMTWTGLTFYGRGRSPRYVLDGWRDGSTTALLEAYPSKQTVQLSEVEVWGLGDGASGIAIVDVPGPNPLEGERFGAVTQDAARVEFHYAYGGASIEARLIDLPPSLPFAFDAYWFGSGPNDTASGEVVAVGADGTILGSDLPPLVDTTPIATLRAFGSRWSVKDSRAADGYEDVACVEPAAATTPHPCKRPLGGGHYVQIFRVPIPAVFVSVVEGPRVGVAIRMNDGTVIHPLRLEIPGSGDRYVAVFALDGGGPGRLIYHVVGQRIYEGPHLRWPDLGQVVGDGSFSPPNQT